MILWNRSINDNIKWHNRVKYFPKNPGTGEYRILEITQRIHDGADCYPWRKTFALWPRRSISGQWIWMSVVYKRRFWVMWGTGFHMEPEVEYATILEILADKRET
jgi:hypothetical protein